MCTLAASYLPVSASATEKSSEPMKENYFSVILETWRVLLQFLGSFQSNLKPRDNGGRYVLYRVLLAFVCSFQASRFGHFFFAGKKPPYPVLEVLEKPAGD